jgi:mannose/fructose/N-acetylgalactosamine-specific phosphotransferase system component IID
MKPSRPSNTIFLALASIAVILGLFVIGGFANQFLKQVSDFNDETREPSLEEIN